jgi:hypothetical protein
MMSIKLVTKILPTKMLTKYQNFVETENGENLVLSCDTCDEPMQASGGSKKRPIRQDGCARNGDQYMVLPKL